MCNIRIGIIGTGRIAKRFVVDVKGLSGININVIYNPHIDSAIRFSKELGGLKVAYSLRDFMRQCDVVYVASPHETHAYYTNLAIDADKHVICEKPMFLSSNDAKKILRNSKEKNRYIMEAIKTKYCPGYKKLLEISREGIIGNVKDVEACFTKLESVNARELTNREYGGSFKELGTYCLLPIYDLLGDDYKNIHYFYLDNDFGIDLYSKLMFDYGDRCGTVKVGLGVKSEGQLIISGTKGYIIVRSPWWKTSHFEIHYEDPGKVDVFDIPYEGEGLRYELEEMVNMIRATKQENVLDEEQMIFMSKIMESFTIHTRGDQL